MYRHSPRIKRAAGFTLMELLVALVILGMLAGIVGPRIMKYVGGAKSDTAKVQIEDLVNALHMYQLEVGNYPSQEAGLLALVEEPQGVVGWNGPYLSKPRVPKDPWGRDYQYLSPGQHGEIDVYSLGKDGQPGGEGEDADIGNWTE